MNGDELQYNVARHLQVGSHFNPLLLCLEKKCNTACRMKSYASELIKGNVRENRKLENELHVSFPGVYSEEKVQRSLDAMKGRRDNLIQVDVFSLEFY